MTSTKHFCSLCVQQTSIIYWIKESSQSKHSRLLIGSSIYHGEMFATPRPAHSKGSSRQNHGSLAGSMLSGARIHFFFVGPGKTAREWNYFMDFWCMICMAICYRHTWSGWWFGCHFWHFPIYWECPHPNWRSYFSEGWPNHQPVMDLYFMVIITTSLFSRPAGEWRWIQRDDITYFITREISESWTKKIWSGWWFGFFIL